MTARGDWIVIECNDAMESGHAGASPLGMWQSILDAIGKTHRNPNDVDPLEVKFTSFAPKTDCLT